MSISALANAFNSVYIKQVGCLDVFILNPKPAISAFICEFFAGVAPPQYVLKRD